GAIRRRPPESLGMGPAAVLRTADAVSVRAGSAVFHRALDSSPAERRAGDGLPDHRGAGGLPRACGAVPVRAPIYRQPAMVLRGGHRVHAVLAVLRAVSGGGEGPRDRAIAVADASARQVRRGSALHRADAASSRAAGRLAGGARARAARI